MAREIFVVVLRLRDGGAQAWLLWGMWNLSSPTTDRT